MDDNNDIKININSDNLPELTEYIKQLNEALRYYKYVVSITCPEMLIQPN